MNWERKAGADTTNANAKMYFKEKYQEKVMYWKAMARNMGYVNTTEEMKDKLVDALTQAQQVDREYVN